MGETGSGHSARADETIRDCPDRWPVVESVEHFSGPVFSVRSDQVRMTDGQVVERDYIVHPGAVGIIALDEDDRVLMVHQYRHPVGWRLWEPPAGLLDKPGENPLAAACRELYEEAHHQADDWRVLVDVFNSPGCSGEAIRVFLARGLSEVDGEQFAREHEETDMPVLHVPLAELVDLILAGELHNPTLVAGVLAVAAARTRPGGLDALRPANAPWPQRPYTS